MIPLRPSASPIWTKCALAPRLMLDAPPEQASDPAREGTCAAWVAEMVFRGEFDDCHAMIDQQHENGWVVDVPMAYHIQRYVDMLRMYGGNVHVERKVRLNEMTEGTPDAFGVVNGSHLFVDDLKYGMVIVEPRTPQVIIYAGALVRLFGPVIQQVTLGIYQPRAYHPSGIHRTVTMSVTELMLLVEDIEARGAMCQRDDATATPGTHCRYCSGAARCSAATHEIYEMHHVMFNGQQREMTMHEMAQELDYLTTLDAMVKGRRDAILAEADARQSRGEQLPGWMKQQGYGQRKWTVDAATVESVTGVNPRTDKMVTPAEMERRKVSPELIAAMTMTPRTKASWSKVPDGYYSQLFGG